MSKKKKQKENNNKPGPQGMYYGQKKCELCQKLIVASNSKSYNGAMADLGRKMKLHRQQCQKEIKQLNLTIPGPEQEQTESIKRVSLRGDISPLKAKIRPK